MGTKVKTLDNLGIAILEPRGSLIGGDEIDELRVQARELFEGGNRKLIIDLGRVNHINSSGIGTLVSIHAMYAKAQGKAKLCAVGKGVENVFVITKLASVFDVEETRDAAVKSLSFK